MKTIDYSQPDFYHFSQDVVRMAEWISPLIEKEKIKTLIDVFAGSGVLGAEIYHRCHGIERLCFVEKQKDFFTHLIQNTKSLPCSREYICGEAHQFSQLYDETIIVANPPFYFFGEGREPKGKNKRACHFMDKSSWLNFLEKTNPYEHVYFMAREQSQLTSTASSIERVAMLSDDTALFKRA